MFEFEAHAHGQTHPWTLSLDKRMQMYRQDDIKVVYYYPHPDSSTFRYRCFNMANAINAHLDHISASWFCESDEWEYLASVIRQADVLVICRSMYTGKVAQMIQIARRWGTRVLFDCDDYLFDCREIPRIVAAQCQAVEMDMETAWNTWFGWSARLRLVLELCDGLIVTNDYLADQAAGITDLPVYVIPNFMGDDQVDYSNELFAAKQANANRRNGRICVGYYSGSASHARDFGLVSLALSQLLRERDDLDVRIVGYLNLENTELAKLEQRVEKIPLVGYLELQRLIAQAEICLSPLENTKFNNCKSQLFRGRNKYDCSDSRVIPMCG